MTAIMLDELTGREYLRVSKAKNGLDKSNDEQHAENLTGAAAGGITLTGTRYSDKARASRTSKAARAGFDRLMADLTNDTFDADVLVMWEASRGSRRVGEWATLLDLLEDRKVKVFVTTHNRTYEPANPRDRRTLLEDAIDSEYESAKIGLRVGRASRASAASGGMPGGRRAFGYQRSGGDLDETEAKIVRECVRRVLAGETVRSIAKDLNRRGIKTSTGNAWHPGPLRNMLAGTRIAGIRTHHGVVTAKGTWTAIIDEDTHRRVVATLANRAPIGRRGRTPWLLTGLLRCGRCGATLTSNTDSSGKTNLATRRYKCRKAPGYHGCGRLVIKAEPLEELLGDLATERLADVEARRHADAGTDDDGELAELDRIAAKRIALADDYAADKISRETKNEEAAALDRRQREVETRLAAKVRASAPLDFVIAEGFIGRPWADLEPDEQRIVLDALVNHVTVGPATTIGSNAFEAARVTKPGDIAWKV